MTATRAPDASANAIRRPRDEATALHSAPLLVEQARRKVVGNPAKGEEEMSNEEFIQEFGHPEETVCKLCGGMPLQHIEGRHIEKGAIEPHVYTIRCPYMGCFRYAYGLTEAAAQEEMDEHLTYMGGLRDHIHREGNRR